MKQAVTDGSGNESPAAIRHRTLTELRRTIQRHPAVRIAYGDRYEDGQFREVTVEFDPHRLGADSEDAGLRIKWRPRADPAEWAYFVFHYSESTGRDFGWHREPNPHVDGLTHFQEREHADEDYLYEPASFDTDVPVELLWDVLGRIETKLKT